MSTSVTLQKTQDVPVLPLAKPLDESVWQAWVRKGRAQDERSHAAAMKAVTWISLVTLLPVAAGFHWAIRRRRQVPSRRGRTAADVSDVPFAALRQAPSHSSRHSLGAMRSWCPMHNIGLNASKSALTSLFVYGVMSAAARGADLSQYRNIQFGTDLPAVAKQVGVSASEAKVIHSPLRSSRIWSGVPEGWDHLPRRNQ